MKTYILKLSEIYPNAITEHKMLLNIITTVLADFSQNLKLFSVLNMS